MNINSRLMKRLNAEIATAVMPVHQACLKVQRALVFARHGQISLAREQLTILHQLSFQSPHPELGAWLHFAEGLMSYYTDFSDAAQGKILRSQILARSAGMDALMALCGAWLAQLAYVCNDLEKMVMHAEACDRLAAKDHHAARYRLCTVMGLSYDLTSQVSVAQSWYSKARSHALAEGDDASLSALMYNMAQMRVAQVRRNSLSIAEASGAGLLIGIDSIKNYDAVVGGSVRPDLTPILRAQILTVEGDFVQARALLEENLPQAMSAGLARLGGSLLADLAWCRVNTGQPEYALQEAKEAEAEADLDPDCDVDDRASTHSRLAQVYGALGDAEKAKQHEARAADEWREFAERQAIWAKALEELKLRPH